MAWTYDVTLLQSATAGFYSGSTLGVRYQIRLLLQDVQTARQLLQDEEIDWFQTTEMNAYMAAAAACSSLVARAGNVKSKRIGDLSLGYDPQFYDGLRLRLQARGMTYQLPYAGGLSIADKMSQQGNVDAVVPRFFLGLGDNPGASQPSPGTQVSASINNPNAI